jgi:hypothetical protein
MGDGRQRKTIEEDVGEMHLHHSHRNFSQYKWLPGCFVTQHPRFVRSGLSHDMNISEKEVMNGEE